MGDVGAESPLPFQPSLDCRRHVVEGGRDGAEVRVIGLLHPGAQVAVRDLSGNFRHVTQWPKDPRPRPAPQQRTEHQGRHRGTQQQEPDGAQRVVQLLQWKGLDEEAVGHRDRDGQVGVTVGQAEALHRPVLGRRHDQELLGQVLRKHGHPLGEPDPVDLQQRLGVTDGRDPRERLPGCCAVVLRDIHRLGVDQGAVQGAVLPLLEQVRAGEGVGGDGHHERGD